LDLDLVREYFPLLQEKFKELFQVVVTGRTCACGSYTELGAC
jgi:hypothetical protein